MNGEEQKPFPVNTYCRNSALIGGELKTDEFGFRSENTSGKNTSGKKAEHFRKKLGFVNEFCLSHCVALVVVDEDAGNWREGSNDGGRIRFDRFIYDERFAPCFGDTVTPLR